MKNGLFSGKQECCSCRSSVPDRHYVITTIIRQAFLTVKRRMNLIHLDSDWALRRHFSLMSMVERSQTASKWVAIQRSAEDGPLF